MILSEQILYYIIYILIKVQNYIIHIGTYYYFDNIVLNYKNDYSSVLPSINKMYINVYYCMYSYNHLSICFVIQLTFILQYLVVEIKNN